MNAACVSTVLFFRFQVRPFAEQEARVQEELQAGQAPDGRPEAVPGLVREEAEAAIRGPESGSRTDPQPIGKEADPSQEQRQGQRQPDGKQEGEGFFFNCESKLVAFWSRF